jgi:hypothetical protein
MAVHRTRQPITLGRRSAVIGTIKTWVAFGK